MKKDKRIFNGNEAIAVAQTKYEKNLAACAIRALFPDGVVLDKKKITSDSNGKNGCRGYTFTLKYDGKVLFRREYDGEFSFRYESPAFGDVLD